MIANDADAIGSFMADEWVIVSERSFEMVGEPRIKMYGNTAVLTGRVVNTAHFAGQTFEANEWTSDVFVKRDGKWLCVLSHITPVDKDFEAAMKENNQ